MMNNGAVRSRPAREEGSPSHREFLLPCGSDCVPQVETSLCRTAGGLRQVGGGAALSTKVTSYDSSAGPGLAIPEKPGRPWEGGGAEVRPANGYDPALVRTGPRTRGTGAALGPGARTTTPGGEGG